MNIKLKKNYCYKYFNIICRIQEVLLKELKGNITAKHHNAIFGLIIIPLSTTRIALLHMNILYITGVLESVSREEKEEINTFLKSMKLMLTLCCSTPDTV